MADWAVIWEAEEDYPHWSAEWYQTKEKALGAVEKLLKADPLLVVFIAEERCEVTMETKLAVKEVK